MNVIVSNRQKEIIDNANIDAIKDLNGLFNVDDLINKFKNYFFSKMILDATSVVNFASKDVLRRLVDEIGAEKLIILLPSKPEPPTDFKRLLIDLQIFNFTNNIEDVVKFIEKPNTYEDAIKTLDENNGNDMYVDNSIKDGENGESSPNEEEPKNEENDSVSTLGQLGNENSSSPSKSLDSVLNNFSIQDTDGRRIPRKTDVEEDDGTVKELSEIPTDEEKYDYEYNLDETSNEETSEEKLREEEEANNEEVHEEETPKEEHYGNTFLISGNVEDNNYQEEKKEKKVIGFRNVTESAGSTSLIYMMHKIASVDLKKNTLSIELNKKDFKFYRDNRMVSIENDKIQEAIENSREEIIFVDLNGFDDDSFCTDVIYLVEPSTIKLNKLMVDNKDIFKDLKNKKVVLNKSLLSKNDIRTLASEAGMDFFYNIEPLNDRISNDSVRKFLDLLNIN